MSSLTRVQVTTKVTQAHTFFVDGVATDVDSGNVVYTVKRLDGTLIDSGNATHGATGVYSFSLLPSAVLDTYTIDWVGTFGGAPITIRDYVEIVGGFMFSLAQARNLPPILNAVTYPDSLLAAERPATEVEAEDIIGCALVPRFRRVAFDGNNTPDLLAYDPFIRTIRAVKVNGTAMTVDELAGVQGTDSGIITLDTGAAPGAVWPRGRRNVIVEYEHGLDMCPLNVSTAGVQRLRYRLTLGDTSVPYRAISFSTSDGGTYRLSTPGKKATGMPDVDAAYQGAGIDLGGFA